MASQLPHSPIRRDEQLRHLRFLDSLTAALAGCGSDVALYATAVQRVSTAFGGASALLTLDPVRHTLTCAARSGAGPAPDGELAAQAAREERSLTGEDTLAAPVIVEGHVWGVLGVRRTDAFSREERRALRSAAERLATHLECRRALLLDDVLDDLLRKTKPIDIYNHALREIRRFILYDHSASVITVQPGATQMTVRAEKVVRQVGNKASLVDSARRGRSLRLTAAQTRFLADLNDPIVHERDDSGYHLADAAPNVDAAGLWRALRLGSDPAEGTMVSYPLVFGGQMLGLLRLACTPAGRFAPLERFTRVLERFARLLAVTIYRSELYYQSDRQLRAIKEMSRAITEPRPEEDICSQALDLALRVLHVSVGSVGLLDENGNLTLCTQRGCNLDAAPLLQVGRGIAGRAVQTGTPQAVPDVDANPDYVVFNSRVRSELAVPITYQGEVMGFLDVESFEQGRFREEDEEVISFLETLANGTAIAIKTSKLHFDALRRLPASIEFDPALSTAALQDLLMTELRDKIEELDAANRAKSDFLARMSHDLRGPLNVIVGLANLLTDPELAAGLTPEKQRESLEVIRSSGQVLSSLIGDILDLSSLEAGRVTLTPAPLDTRAAFAYLETMASRLAAEHCRSLNVSVAVEHDVSMITVDEEKFLRIMINLISNAVKFTPDGGRIDVSVRATDGCALHVEVSDTGIGISPEHREVIFQPFRRLPGTAAGTGLGLAVVRHLVDLHGGDVWVDDGPDGGSAFHVVLPSALAAPSGLIPASRAEPAPVLVGNRGLVLVVEDTKMHMDLMRLAVSSRGYTVHGAVSAEEALLWLEHEHPDIILLDMQLPAMSGFELAAILKGSIETHTIPIVAVTADALTATEERARASGCDAYLTKPIDLGALLSTVDRLTGRVAVE